MTGVAVKSRIAASYAHETPAVFSCAYVLRRHSRLRGYPRADEVTAGDVVTRRYPPSPVTSESAA